MNPERTEQFFRFFLPKSPPRYLPRPGPRWEPKYEAKKGEPLAKPIQLASLDSFQQLRSIESDRDCALPPEHFLAATWMKSTQNVMFRGVIHEAYSEKYASIAINVTKWSSNRRKTHLSFIQQIKTQKSYLIDREAMCSVELNLDPMSFDCKKKLGDGENLRIIDLPNKGNLYLLTEKSKDIQRDAYLMLSSDDCSPVWKQVYKSNLKGGRQSLESYHFAQATFDDPQMFGIPQLCENQWSKPLNNEVEDLLGLIRDHIMDFCMVSQSN